MLPNQWEQLFGHLHKFAVTHDLYYCPQLLSRAKRSKETVITCPTLWADLDNCPPEKLLVKPTILVQTSPNRYQALWIVKPSPEPAVAEEVSRRIAYYHAEDGADKSGWDLTQLLRVPFSFNHKYRGAGTLPTIDIKETNATPLAIEDFEVYPEAEGHEYSTIPFPESLPNKTPEQILDDHRTFIVPQVWTLFSETPTSDWSKSLWVLENYLFEAGLSREEVFAVVREAKCNKYNRDGRSERMLWKDVCRAWSNYDAKAKALPTGPVTINLTPLLTDEERLFCQQEQTIIEEYIEWAKTIGDAAWQYHEVGAFVILSSLLAGTVRLPTSFGLVIPNLWFMILADTTLTRKSTAMDLAVDVVAEIDSDIILATDGSLEGLLTSLSMRPGRPSVFLRDEFTGLLEAMSKKDYYAGMAETLTKLYDGRLQKRVLRKEILEVRDPCLIFFAGGIKTRTLELLNTEHVASGFLPRFLLVTAESDVTKLKPLGPPTEQSTAKRDEIIAKFRSVYRAYHGAQSVSVDGKTVAQGERKWNARLTDRAWALYNEYESAMLQNALDLPRSELMTPTFDRMSKSALKIAVLIAAVKKEGEPEIVVEPDDIKRAFYYIERWRPHVVDVIQKLGLTAQERQVEMVLTAVRKKPGILRSELMQTYHMTAREANLVFETLEQRGLVSRTKNGKTEHLYPVEA